MESDSPPDALVFVRTRHNKNSLMALLGAVEGEPRLAGLAVSVVKGYDPACVPLTGARTIVALSFTTFDVFDVRSYVRALRGRAGPRSLTIVVGGPHVTARPADVSILDADYGVVGEGEVAFVKLLLALRALRPASRVPGVVVRHRSVRGASADQGSRSASPVSPVSPASSARQTPAVTWVSPRALVDLDAHFPLSRQFWWFAPVEISRGCYFRCQFCQTGALFRQMRHRSVPCIVAATKRLVDLEYTDVRFLSPDAFRYGSTSPRRLAPRRVAALLSAVRAVPGVEKVFFGTFPSEVRPDSVTREVLEVVREHVANDRVSIGLQTADDRLLRALHRGHTLADFWAAVDLLEEFGFTPLVDFIFGLPGETAETVAANVRAIKTLQKRHAQVRGHTFTPLPGTALASAPPGRVDPCLEKVLSYAQGDWEEQERAAHAIAAWLRGEFPP